MKVDAIKTKKILPGETTLISILDKYIQSFKEGSILAITSKIVSVCEGRVVSADKTNKDRLVEAEADFYLPKEENKYDVYLTIKDNMLVPTAGIDESNAGGFYILWPADPQKTANEVREYLVGRFKVKKAGVIITDSKTTPLRWGTTGTAIAHSGFQALRDYIGREDLFGRPLRMTKANVIDSLAAAAVFEMGEGNEGRPIAVITGLENVEFQDRNPTREELSELRISIDDDLYAPLLKSAAWRTSGMK